MDEGDVLGMMIADCRLPIADWIRRHHIFVVLLILLTAVWAQGRVFWRWGMADNIRRVLEDAGGRMAYETNMNINGRDGRVTVYGFRGTAHRKVCSMNGMNMRGGDSVTRLVTVSLSESTVVFVMETPDETAPPNRHYLQALPAFPQSVPVFYARDGETGTSLSVSSSHESPGTVMNFYDAALRASGWHTPLAGMSTYLKGREIALVRVDTDNLSRKTRITLLHKKQGIK